MPQAKASLWGYQLPDHTHAASLFGIAPGGACHAGPVTRPAVRSYRTVSPLPASKRRRFLLCGAIPQVTLAGRYPAPLLHGVRTFLSDEPQRGEVERATNKLPKAAPLSARKLIVQAAIQPSVHSAAPSLHAPIGQPRIARQATLLHGDPAQSPVLRASGQSAGGMR